MTQIDDDIRDLKSRPASEWAQWIWQRVIGGLSASRVLIAPTLALIAAAILGGVGGAVLVAEPTSTARGWLESHNFVSPIPQAAPIVYNDGSGKVLGQLQIIYGMLDERTRQIAGEIKASRDLASGYDIHLSAIAESIKADLRSLPAQTAAAVPKPTKTIVYDKHQKPVPALEKIQ